VDAAGDGWRSGDSWPLVGRAAELAAVAAARAAGRPGAVIDGAAGLGKSRLAREALAAAARNRALTAWVQGARSAAGVPLGAYGGTLSAGVRSDDPFELMQLSVQALRQQAGGRPLVLVVDDAQWLDPASATLTMHLARTGTAFVIATVRTGEPCPDAIVWLWKDAGAPRVELQLLTSAETAALAEAVAGGPLDRQARRWVHQASHGNALYACELVRGALADGSLALEGGLWRLTVRPAVSASLAELITARMSGLSAAERRAVELLALGEPLRLPEILALAGADPLASVQERGLLAVDGTDAAGQVRLSHPLYGEVIRAALPSLRARELRLALAQAVRQRSEPEPEDTLRVTRWLLDAGEQVPAESLLGAARAASLAGDPAFAAALAERALQAGGGVEAALLLARAHALQSQFEQAEEVLRAAEDSLKTHQQALEYLERQSEVLHWGLGRPSELRALLDRAAQWWEGDAEWAGLLEPLRLRLASFVRLGSAAPASAEAPEPSAGDDARRDLETVQVANLFYVGRTREAHERVTRIRPGPPVGTLGDAIALTLWGRISLEDGEQWPELDAGMTAVIEDGVRLRDYASAGTAAYTLACLRFLQGRYLDAAALLAEAESQLRRHDPLALLTVVAAQQVGVAAMTGDQGGADHALQRCRERLGGEGPLGHQLPYVVRAEAWAAYAHADRRRAQEALLGAAREMSASPVHAAGLTYEAMLAGAPARQLARPLAALRDRCDARLVALYAGHAAALAAEDGPALLQAAEDLEAVGALRYATTAAADAARSFLAVGRQDSARRARKRSHELFADGQGASPPQVDGLDGPAVNLTAREAQIVALAAEGLTNAQIAERTVLAVRTVESHLYRAMQKLGVSDRRDL
jgi:DNA-binding NarL/FixJ family response regulator